jgi:hypothetical protein
MVLCHNYFNTLNIAARRRCPPGTHFGKTLFCAGCGEPPPVWLIQPLGFNGTAKSRKRQPQTRYCETGIRRCQRGSRPERGRGTSRDARPFGRDGGSGPASSPAERLRFTLPAPQFPVVRERFGKGLAGTLRKGTCPSGQDGLAPQRPELPPGG